MLYMLIKMYGEHQELHSVYKIEPVALKVL